ncbi:hypothetical protein EVAR_84438_1 [Eumeta japonica]|uniref:Uncharacterized protein n=1 Tax=Eumeta variegata TaxID=151549 RepID=A0A4C1W4E0_EUMVA|nr:hypothetical protein EVAR_84438_1 [Eumeta japonica]
MNNCFSNPTKYTRTCSKIADRMSVAKRNSQSYHYFGWWPTDGDDASALCVHTDGEIVPKSASRAESANPRQIERGPPLSAGGRRRGAAAAKPNAISIEPIAPLCLTGVLVALNEDS